MSASQQLRAKGGPIGVLNDAMQGVEKVLAEHVAADGQHEARVALRKILVDAVIAAYTHGQAKGA